jgi:hypothetical protein
VLVLVVILGASIRAHAERNAASAPRAPTTSGGSQSWTVYAPSGRPVILRQDHGTGRWWPSK